MTTIYSLKTISQHTKISLKYLQNPDSPLKRVINTFPEISPDGKGLNDMGLMVFDSYVENCSNRNGKPKMKFNDWIKTMIDEYELTANGAEEPVEVMEESSLTITTPTTLSTEPIQPIRIGGMMESFKERIDAMGDELASETATVLDDNIAKIQKVIVSRAEQLNATLNALNK